MHQCYYEAYLCEYTVVSVFYFYVSIFLNNKRYASYDEKETEDYEDYFA